MKIGTALVTGAGGFIGSHLVERLVEKGGRVRAMIRYNSANSWGLLEELPPTVLKDVEVVSGDVRDPFFCARSVRNVDTVFHLAALIGIPYSYNAPQSYVETNISGTLNMLEACRDSGVQRLVHTSTSETYGTAQYTPIDEKHPLVGQSPYSASKISGDKLAESYNLSFDLPVVTVRPFNAYGPRQSARAVIPTIMSQALSGRGNISLGSLTPVRDLTLVKDTVEGFIAAAESDKAVGRTINVGYGKGVSIGELAHRVCSICESRAEIVSDESRIRPEKSEVMELVCDNSLARELLGWTPKYTLDQGLEMTAQWIRTHMDRYKVNQYVV